MVESGDKDIIMVIITLFHIFKKPNEKLNMLSKDT